MHGQQNIKFHHQVFEKGSGMPFSGTWALKFFSECQVLLLTFWHITTAIHSFSIIRKPVPYVSVAATAVANL